MKTPLTSDDKHMIVLVAIFLGALLWTVFYFTGSCEVLSRLPLKDTPGRCLR